MKASQIVALDNFALQAARGLSARQPRGDNTIPQLPSTTPVLTDIAVISRPQAIPGGGYDYGVTLAQLQALIGGGGGIPQIAFNTDLSPLTVYNYGNFVNTPSAGQSANTAALAAMFTAMENASGLGGGYAWIPQYSFPVAASATGLTLPTNAIIQGLGTGGSGGAAGYQFSISDGTGFSGYTLFSSTGQHNSGGTMLRNLSFRWVNPAWAVDTVLNLNYWNMGIDQCTFTDCPVAVNFNGALACSMTRCTIEYGVNSSVPANTTAIWLVGIQCEISGPSAFGGGTPSGTTDTCMSIGGGNANCDHNVIRNVHMVGWNYGIDYSDINGTGIDSGTQNNVIDSCHFEVNATAINMVPFSSSGQIFNQKIVNCVIEKGHNSQTGQPIVYIDSNGGSVNNNIGPIFLVNNTIYSNVAGGSGQGGGGSYTGVAQNNQYGVQIGDCAFVSIIGGQISQCGTQGGSDGTANVCISGDAVRVVIDGANLSPTYIGVNAGHSTGSTGSGASQYGLLISGNPASVNVTGCTGIGVVSITGNPTVVTLDSCNGLTELSVTGSPTTLTATNCAGYNDQNKNIVGNGTIGTGTAYTAATAGTVLGGTAINYFGPSFLMFTANSSGGTVAVNGGTPQTLVDSQIVCLYLNSPYDSIEFATHAPSALQWLGK